MSGRVGVLVAGLLVAFASALTGCVAQTADDGDDGVDQSTAPLVVVVAGDDDDDGIADEAMTTRASTTVTTTLSRPNGHDVMGEPEPVPWNPPDTARSEQGSSSRGH